MNATEVEWALLWARETLWDWLGVGCLGWTIVRRLASEGPAPTLGVQPNHTTPLQSNSKWNERNRGGMTPALGKADLGGLVQTGWV